MFAETDQTGDGRSFICNFCIFSYRAIVLRALPNLEILDNVGVTQEELNEALKAGPPQQREEEVYEDAYANGPTQQQAYQQQSPNREVSISQGTPRNTINAIRSKNILANSVNRFDISSNTNKY